MKLEQYNGAAAVPGLDRNVLHLIKVKIPTDRKIQQKIASILSAYDDLIENNLKRIKLLEEAAQNIYKEWFVHFRFPGYEDVVFENGLPEGWEKINLYDFAHIQMGYSFKGEEFNDAGFGMPVIRIRDIPNQWTDTSSNEKASGLYIVEKGDVLIGMDGFFYTDIWCGQRGYLVQRVCRIRAKNEDLQGYLLESLREPIKYFEKTITGATVAHLGAKHLKEIVILVPEGNIKNKLIIFNDLNKEKMNLYSQNQSLKTARDILLPRLMNQTIQVE